MMSLEGQLSFRRIELDLTDQQVDAMTPVPEKSRERMAALRRQFRDRGPSPEARDEMEEIREELVPGRRIRPARPFSGEKDACG